ncbi:hypothetical protein B0H13DRAFT_2322538 [Mycena leptocephala]|nr:hypothetical protein B0H13DRAFT_2322538 [Mycena leptocephala]
MLALCPDAALTPREVKAILVGHQPHSLATARLGVEYHNPLTYNWNRDAYIKPWVGSPAPPTYEAAYTAILFGAITAAPADAGTRCFKIGRPDWSDLGWPAGVFKTPFEGQLESLRLTAQEDVNIDLDDDLYPIVDNWTAGDHILIQGWADAVYHTFDSEGQYHVSKGSSHTPVFPIPVGETVMIEATLHRTDWFSGWPYHTRDYWIALDQVKIPISAMIARCRAALSCTPERACRVCGQTSMPRATSPSFVPDGRGASLADAVGQRNPQPPRVTSQSIPAEVVMEIFEDVLPSYPACGDLLGPRSAVNLTQICASWRKIAVANPKLWRAIKWYPNHNFDRYPKLRSTGLEMVAVYLERSKSLPLSLEQLFPSEFEEEWLEVVLTHQHRWAHVTISIELESNLRRLEAPMPLLQFLNLSSGLEMETNTSG